MLDLEHPVRVGEPPYSWPSTSGRTVRAAKGGDRPRWRRRPARWM